MMAQNLVGISEKLAGLIMQYLPPKSIITEDTINDIPVLHALAETRIKDEECADFEIVVGEFVSRGYDINRRTNNFKSKKRSAAGFTCLLAAIDRKNVNAVKILIANGADVCACDDEGYSCLHWCALVNDSSIMGLLLEAGADVNVTTKSGIPVIHIAQSGRHQLNDFFNRLVHRVDEGHLEIVNKLLQKDGNMIKWVARYTGFLQPDEVDKYASPYNIDVQGEEVKWCTPFERAVYMSKVDVTKLLLMSGSNFKGLDLLHYSVRRGDIRIANVLLSYVPENVSLAGDQVKSEPALLSLPCRCFSESSEDMSKFLESYIMRGYDINILASCRKICECFESFNLSKESLTMVALLHLSVLHNNIEMVELMVECGADVNVLTGDGNTPLFLAICIGNVDIAKYLLSKGADANKKGWCFDKYNTSEDRTMIQISPLSAAIRALGICIATFMLSVIDCYQIRFNGLEEFSDSIREGCVTVMMMVLDALPEDVSLQSHTIDGVPSLTYILYTINEHEMKLICFESLLKAFVHRGYDLNQTCEKVEPLLYVVLERSLKFNSPQIFNELMKLNKCDPNIKFEGSSALNALFNGFGQPYIQNCCRPYKPRHAYCALNFAERLLQCGAIGTGCTLPNRFCIHPEQSVILKSLKVFGVSFPNDGVLCLRNYTVKGVGNFCRNLMQFNEKYDHTVKKLKHIARLSARQLAVRHLQDEFLIQYEGLPSELKKYLNLQWLKVNTNSSETERALELELDNSCFYS